MLDIARAAGRDDWHLTTSRTAPEARCHSRSRPSLSIDVAGSRPRRVQRRALQTGSHPRAVAPAMCRRPSHPSRFTWSAITTACANLRARRDLRLQHSRGVDRNLVSARLEHATMSSGFARRPDSQRHEAGVGCPLHDINHRAAFFVARRDVRKRARRRLAHHRRAPAHRIRHRADRRVDALDGAPSFTSRRGMTRTFSVRPSRRRGASALSAPPATLLSGLCRHRARPRIAPSMGRPGRAFSARMSSTFLSPPEAITGMKPRRHRASEVD